MRNKITGLTLLEVLVALSIFAVVMLVTSFSLRAVLKTEQQLWRHYIRLRSIILAIGVLQSDYSQKINRPVLSKAGKQLPAFIRHGSHYIEFTTAGLGMPQRIAYTYHDGVLYRLVWPVLDRVDAAGSAYFAAPFREVLLSHIRSIHIDDLPKGLSITFLFNPDAQRMRIVLCQ